MYNINSHYENILAYANTIIAQPTVIYFHPFGTSQPENIEALQNGGFGPLIIAFDQEPLHLFYNSQTFLYIKKNFKNDKGFSRPAILLNTEKVGVEKNKIVEEFKFSEANYFFHGLAAADWYRGYQYCSSLISPSKRKLNKKFISFNRITGNSRVYRSLLVAELAKRNLHFNGHISYSETCPIHGHYSQSLDTAVADFNLSLDYIQEVQQILTSINFPLWIDSNGPIPNGSQTIGPIPQLMESFLHIVTETCFWDTRTHLTEKIFKPIVARQPFVLLGCAGNLKYLQSYGFKTFDRWWDEGYDEIEEPIQRLKKVVQIIDNICSMSFDELENMLKGMKYILDYNYELFYSKDFVSHIWNEMASNLQYAISQHQHRTVKEI